MPETPSSTIERRPEALIFHVAGPSLDEAAAQRLRADVSAESAASVRPVILDLSAVNLIPSIALAALIRILTECRSRQQRMILAGLRPDVHDVIRVTRLDRLFDVRADVAAALTQVGAA